MPQKYLAYLIIFFGAVIFIGLTYFKFVAPRPLRPFAQYTLLTASWENYKNRFINQDGRVIDYTQNSITTSEGQSYALLQAVFMDDKETFDKVWQWTKTTLKRPDDNLFGWRWGELPGKKYGFYPDGGINAAADADTDIALSLIYASRRWRDYRYLEDAKKILTDIWKIETAVAFGKRYVVAGNWAIFPDYLIINPSYFAPYAWREFASIDPGRPWAELITPAYDLITRSVTDPLGSDQPGVLPPNWLSVSTQDGSLSPVNDPRLTTDYSFDAVRLPWRIALDWQWHQEPLAKNFLSKLSFLTDYWQQHQSLPLSFDHTGKVIDGAEYPTMYATSLGYFSVEHPEIARQIYEQKIIPLYSNDSNSFNNDLPYYESNWLWFGSALYFQYLKPVK